MDWTISWDFRGDDMEILLASVIGYLLGGASVLLTMYLLYDKVHPPAEIPVPEPEARAEPAEPEPPTPEEQRWMEELNALWNYDGKGGAMSGDKENSGRDL